MSQRDYTCSIAANVTTRKAFDSINLVSSWWTANLEGNSQKLNDVFTVRFGKTFATMKLIEVIADKKIVWDVIDGYLNSVKDKTEWKGTKIIWEISSDKDSTKINMTHVGLVPEVECYQDCEKGWNFYVKESLFKLLC